MLLLSHDRLKRAIDNGDKDVDPISDKYIADPDDLDYRVVRALHNQTTRRSYVEACLLVTDDYDAISDILEIPPGLIELYAKIYYDVSGWDRVSKIDLATSSRTEDERNLKLWAMSQGLRFISWRLGKKVSISAVDGLTELFNDCIFKSKEALFNNNSSVASRESAKWVKLSLDIGKVLKSWVGDSDVAQRDIELALKEVIPEFSSVDELNKYNDMPGLPKLPSSDVEE